jgi:propanol-preferring alcohol dehydrogenase
MRAMVLEVVGQPLILKDLPKPAPGPNQILIRVEACAICRTDLHILDGDLHPAKLPLIPGHEAVGYVEALGIGASHFRAGDRVGVPWLAWTCGECRYCRNGQENLCDAARFTGYTVDGGYAEYMVAYADYCVPMTNWEDDPSSAPLLCAGVIGYRSLRRAGDPWNLGLFGFGAAAHIITQVARYEERRVFAFTRPGDSRTQQFARRVGAVWASGTDEAPPVQLDAAIIFAPAGELVPIALKSVRKGGIVVCGGIHMSEIPAFPYSQIWEERQLCSVANLTRRDAREFIDLAAKIPVRTDILRFKLEEANAALEHLRAGRIKGAAVLCLEGDGGFTAGRGVASARGTQSATGQPPS